MDECLNRKLGDLIHAYELDMLDAEQRREFEVHLMQCEACLNRLGRFQGAARLLQGDPDIRTAAASVDRQAADGSRAVGRSKRPRWMPLSLAAAAVLVLLLLQPWNFRIDTSTEVAAAPNRLVVLYFEDLSGLEKSTDLGRITSNLLIADLAQVSSIEVMSTARLYDIARILGVDNPDSLRNASVERIGRLAQCRWIITGAVIERDSQIVLTAELQASVDGSVEHSFQSDTFPVGDVFGAVSDLSGRIVRYLEPARHFPDTASAIERITSTSLEAYRHYLDGIDFMERVEYEQAVASFQEALKLDHTMSMAYYHLSRLLDRSLIYEASRYIDRAGRVEQYYIRGAYFSYRGQIDSAIAMLETTVDSFPAEKMAWKYLGDFLQREGQLRRAAACYTHTIELDPSYRVGYNALAYIYEGLGEIDSSLSAIDRYIAIAPTEANPYDTKGEILGRHGRLKEAIEAFEKALSLNPDFHHARAYLGYMYSFGGQYDRADSCFKRLAFVDNPALRHAARLYEIYPLVRQGLFDTALVLLDQAIDVAATPEVARVLPAQRLYLYHAKAMVLAELGRVDQALELLASGRELAGSMASPDSVLFRAYQIELMQSTGLISDAEFEFDDFAGYLSRHPIDTPYGYWYAGALLAERRGSLDSAVALNRKSVAAADTFVSRLGLAKSLLHAGRFEESREIFEALRRIYTSESSSYSIEGAKLDYYLGLVHESLGRSSAAIASYETFLDRWKKADQSLATIRDARQRLDRLKAGS